MKIPRIAFITISFISVLILSGCIVVKNSPAPGCMEYIGFAPMGGCMGKTAITDLTLEGFPDCIQVSVNNCNDGVLEVQNTCQTSLTLGGVEIPPEDSFSLDIQDLGIGGFELVRIPSNFSDFIPDSNQHVEIIGSFGDQSVFLSFIKTAPLCEQ